MDVFDLYAKVSLDSSGYTKGIQGVSDSATKLKSNLGSIFGTITKIAAAATAAGAGASIALGKSVVNNAKEIASYGDNIDKMSQKMGMSAEAYQEWDAVMKHSGTSIDSMKASMKILANAAQTNNKAFEQLGITEKELKSLNQEELFAKTIEALQNVDDTTQRTYLAGKLLGRGATELGALLNTSAEDTKKMKERVHQLGGVMSDEGVKAAAKFQDNLQDMQTALSGLKRGIFNDTLPAFNDLMDGFTKLIAGEEGAEEKIDSGMKKLEKAIDKISPKIQKITETLLPKVITIGTKLVTEIAKSLPKIIAEVAPTLFNAGVEIITSVTNGIYDMLNKSNFDEKAKTMTEKVNSMIEKIDTDSSATKFSNIINKFINAAFNITSTFDASKVAEKMSSWLNTAINKLDVAKLGQTVSKAFKDVWDFIGTAIAEIDWENVGNKISEFINNIDWSGILDSMFETIGNLIKAAPELLKGVVEKLDFESAAGLFATLFAPKMASNLLKTIKEDKAVGKDLASAGSNAGNQVGAGLEGTVDETSSSFSTKLSGALSKAAVVAQAFTVGYAIGTRIREGLEDAGIADWLDEHLGKWLDITPMLEKVVGEQQQKEAEKKAKENNKKSAQALKEAGAWWLSGTGTDSTAAIQKAQQIISEYNKYKQLGVTINDVLNNTAKYEQAKAGKLSTSSSGYQQYQKQQQQNWRNNASYYQPGASAATTPINSSIYLDTGALVGGTSRTSAVQQNYTARGYAT